MTHRAHSGAAGGLALLLAAVAWLHPGAAGALAGAQEEAPTPAEERAAEESAAEEPAGDGPAEWFWSASVNVYVVPDTPAYAQPTLSADLGALHLEARYNYEALETASAWVGYNFSIGDELSLDFTPMLGGVFGSAMGIAPGYELDLTYWKLELYSEGEYLFDTDESADSFAYSWSEASIWPVDLFRFGFVAQRTRAYETDVEVQRGLLVGVAYEWASLDAYVFDLDQDEQTWVVGVGVSF